MSEPSQYKVLGEEKVTSGYKTQHSSLVRNDGILW